MKYKLCLFWVALLVTLSFTTQAEGGSNEKNAMEYLKSTPASKFELGKLSMEIGSLVLTQQYNEQKVQGTDFEVKRFSVKEEPDNLFMVIHLEGKAKDMNDEQCNAFLNIFTDMEPFNDLPKNLWPELSESQHDELSHLVRFAVELVSRENESFTLSCN
ncbi:hypothetical protein [Idiomarina sp.]|uniref:hypothetical protein n=1 Tax=Idiomarina sp. TaxID=1874361 RepID=UPI003A950AB2